jgi:hypothetical protein
MNILFDKFKTKIPSFNSEFKDTLFKKFTDYGASSDEKRNVHGKLFENAYELYIYAYFLGLYMNEFVPFTDGVKKDNFNWAIENWGKKNKILRKDYTILQEFIFSSLIAKTDIDFISLDKGEVEIEKVIKDLINTFESYTNGGLLILKRNYDENPSCVLKSTFLLDLILEAKK